MELAVDAFELIGAVIDPIETAIEACIRVDAVSRALPNWRSVVHTVYAVTRDQVTASFLAAAIMPDPNLWPWNSKRIENVLDILAADDRAASAAVMHWLDERAVREYFFFAIPGLQRLRHACGGAARRIFPLAVARHFGTADTIRGLENAAAASRFSVHGGRCASSLTGALRGVAARNAIFYARGVAAECIHWAGVLASNRQKVPVHWRMALVSGVVTAVDVAGGLAFRGVGAFLGARFGARWGCVGGGAFWGEHVAFYASFRARHVLLAAASSVAARVVDRVCPLRQSDASAFEAAEEEEEAAAAEASAGSAGAELPDEAFERANDGDVFSSADHYGVLGVTRDATSEQIRSAYRKEALQHHPDRCASASPEVRAAATARFKEINTAYEVLSEPARRAEYDYHSGASTVPPSVRGGWMMDVIRRVHELPTPLRYAAVAGGVTITLGATSIGAAAVVYNHLFVAFKGATRLGR